MLWTQGKQGDAWCGERSLCEAENRKIDIQLNKNFAWKVSKKCCLWATSRKPGNSKRRENLKILHKKRYLTESMTKVAIIKLYLKFLEVTQEVTKNREREMKFTFASHAFTLWHFHVWK